MIIITKTITDNNTDKITSNGLQSSMLLLILYLTYVTNANIPVIISNNLFLKSNNTKFILPYYHKTLSTAYIAITNGNIL